MKILIYTVIAVLILDIVFILARIRATNKK
ncbi:hypothetical protein TPHSE_17160 [Terrisporobacter petrolearius]